MAKISGTYTIRITDQPAADNAEAETHLVVRVRTSNTEDAAAAAEAIGNALERLGLTIPEPSADR